MLVLDTNILVEIESGNKKIIEEVLSLRAKYGMLSITSAVYAEFLFGFLSINKEKEAEKYVQNFEMINFDIDSAKVFAHIKKILKDKGKFIPIFDLLTASCVISRCGTLITMDNHFENIPNMNLILLD